MSDDITTAPEAIAEITQDVTPEPPTEADSIEKLPKWAQKQIKDLRSESAKYRTANTKAERDAEELARRQAEEQGQYKQLYEQEKARAAQAELTAQVAQVARYRSEVAHKLNVPAALVDRLRGETLEELEADAKTLLDAMPKAATVTTTDSSAGVNGKKPAAQFSDEQIKEMAARLGVGYEHLRKQYVKE
jgi:hypothetical protein